MPLFAYARVSRRRHAVRWQLLKDYNMDLFPGDLRLLTSTFFGGQAGYVRPSAVGAVLYEAGSGVTYVTYASHIRARAGCG